MKLRATGGKQGRAAFLSGFIMFATTLLLYFWQAALVPSQNVLSVQVVSFVGVVELFTILLSWHFSYHRMLCPYIVTVLSLYLCLCGQSLMWAFGIDAGYRDLMLSNYWQFTDLQICKALLFSELCIATLHLVVINRIDPQTRMMRCRRGTKRWRNHFSDESISYSAIITVGLFIAAITIVPYLIDARNTLATISVVGYNGQYASVSYGGDSLFAKIGDFYPVASILILFCWGEKSTYNSEKYPIKCFICYACIAIVIVVSLSTGGRSPAILFALAVVFVRLARRKMKTRTIVVLAALGFVALAAMRGVDLMRSGQIASISDFLTFFGEGDKNAVVDFLGDMGWNLMSLVECQTLMPGDFSFALGGSYLFSLTSVIPNLGFWEIHPSSIYGNLGNWLQGVLGLSYGPGFTPVAEAYYNFGSLGFLAFILWGMLLCWLNRLYENSESQLGQLLVAIFIGSLLKSFVRSSFVSFFRPAFLYLVLIPLFITFISGALGERRSKRDEGGRPYLAQDS